MLQKERGSISDGISYTQVKEEYSTYCLDNINIIIDADICISTLNILISRFLSEKKIAVLFSLIFICKEHSSDSDFDDFAEYSALKFPGIILKSGLNKQSSVQFVCAPDTMVEHKISNNSVRVSTLNVGEISYTYYNAIIPSKLNAGRGKQTYECFSKLSRELGQQNCSLDKINRTWLYLDNILDWYDELNSSRSEFFEEQNLLDKFIPASTGIGLANNSGSSIVLSAFSVQGKDIEVEIAESPLQCAALDYKSSFSRAVIIKQLLTRKLLISGTASIAPEGDTVFVDNAKMQIEKTLEVIAALLNNNNMSFKNVSRAIAYFPQDDFVDGFNEICIKFGLDSDYVLKVHGVVCRPDLLFELEVDAVSGFKIDN